MAMITSHSTANTRSATRSVSTTAVVVRGRHWCTASIARLIRSMWVRLLTGLGMEAGRDRPRIHVPDGDGRLRAANVRRSITRYGYLLDRSLATAQAGDRLSRGKGKQGHAGLFL